jgi:hypothetical protein
MTSSPPARVDAMDNPLETSSRDLDEARAKLQACVGLI